MTTPNTAPTVPSGKYQPLPVPPPTEAEKESRRRAGRRLLAIGVLVVIGLGGALAVGTLPRLKKERAVNDEAATAAATPPKVIVAVARPRETEAERVLPGNSQPLLEAALYARTTGYLRERLVDIGDRVKEGQLLAVIVAPDIDDQLAQSRASLEQARATLALNEANAALAKTTLARYQAIKSENAGAIAPLMIDEQARTVDTTTASVAAAKASIQVNEAMVQRYTDLQRFQKITAPFQGVITARNVDAGDLITADTPSTTREMFHLMQTDVLRVFVNVPQVFATGIKVGQRAVVYRREDPQKQFQGKVTRTADALDPNTRTLLTEVQVPNKTNALRPGMYLQVKFIFDRDVVPVMIPAAALATRTGGPRVGVMDEHHVVHYRTVELGRDYGAEIEVVTGLKAGETVVVHPGDDVPEGTTVESVTPKKPDTPRK